MHNSLLKDAKVTRVMNDQSAAQTSVSTTALDMGADTGYDSVCYIIVLGSVTSTAVQTCTAYDNTTNSNSGGTANSGTAVVATDVGGANANGVIIVDVDRPSGHYQYLTVARSVANSEIQAVIAIQYKAKKVPTTQPSTVVASGFMGPEA